MRTRWLAVLGCLVLMTSVAVPVARTANQPEAVVDQAADSPSGLYDFQLDENSASAPGLGQTVTAGMDGLLTAVDLYLARKESTTADLTIEVRLGGPSGEVMASASVPASEIPVAEWLPPISPPVSPPISPPVSPPVSPPISGTMSLPAETMAGYGGGGWVTVVFPTPVAVRAGDVIAITTGIPFPLPDGGPAWFWAWSRSDGQNPDDYPGGVAWLGHLRPTGVVRWLSFEDGSDLTFRTWVEPRHLSVGPSRSGQVLRGDEGRAWIDGTDSWSECIRYSMWVSVFDGLTRSLAPGAKWEPTTYVYVMRRDLDVCGDDPVEVGVYDGRLGLAPGELSIAPLRRVELHDVMLEITDESGDDTTGITLDLTWVASGKARSFTDTPGGPGVRQVERYVPAEVSGTVAAAWWSEATAMEGEISSLTQVSTPQ